MVSTYCREVQKITSRGPSPSTYLPKIVTKKEISADNIGSSHMVAATLHASSTDMERIENVPRRG